MGNRNNIYIYRHVKFCESFCLQKSSFNINNNCKKESKIRSDHNQESDLIF
jgi:hypothetical protein